MDVSSQSTQADGNQSSPLDALIQLAQKSDNLNSQRLAEMVQQLQAILADGNNLNQTQDAASRDANAQQMQAVIQSIQNVIAGGSSRSPASSGQDSRPDLSEKGQTQGDSTTLENNLNAGVVATSNASAAEETDLNAGRASATSSSDNEANLNAGFTTDSNLSASQESDLDSGFVRSGSQSNQIQLSQGADSPSMPGSDMPDVGKSSSPSSDASQPGSGMEVEPEMAAGLAM